MAKELSKYSSEDCGLAVARVCVARLKSECIDVDDYLEKRATLLLVLTVPNTISANLLQPINYFNAFN